MATWHQQRARVQLWHDTLWTVVTDPPGECTSIMRFEAESEARAFLARIQERGEAHCYMLAPAH